VLDAGTQGMIGYLIQELRILLPPEHQVATLLTMIVVDPQDPASLTRRSSRARFNSSPGPDDGYIVGIPPARADDHRSPPRRRPSPQPRRILEIAPITWLLEATRSRGLCR
jgi:carbamate kinase